MRVKGWERALNATIARHAALPFSWDENNCFYLPMDVVLAVTGQDPWADERGCTSKQNFLRRLARHGFQNVGDAFASRLPEISPAFMGRADIGVIEAEGDLCGVVCLGPDVFGKTENGNVFLPRSRAVRAFGVG